MWPSWLLCLFVLPPRMFTFAEPYLFASLSSVVPVIACLEFPGSICLGLTPAVVVCWSYNCAFLKCVSPTSASFEFSLATASASIDFKLSLQNSRLLHLDTKPVNVIDFISSKPVAVFWYTLTLWGGRSITFPIVINHNHTVKHGGEGTEWTTVVLCAAEQWWGGLLTAETYWVRQGSKLPGGQFWNEGRCTDKRLTCCVKLCERSHKEMLIYIQNSIAISYINWLWPL